MREEVPHKAGGARSPGDVSGESQPDHARRMVGVRSRSMGLRPAVNPRNTVAALVAVLDEAPASDV